MAEPFQHPGIASFLRLLPLMLLTAPVKHMIRIVRRVVAVLKETVCLL